MPQSSQNHAVRFSSKVQDILQFLLLFLVGVALLFGVIKPYLLDAFYVPTSSMVPTLEVNDRVLVNKLVYRFGEPERGDIVVFEAPDGMTRLIKRVVGVPGDRIAVERGTLVVNGERQEEPYLNPELPDESTYGPITVPEGCVFAMGDNRADSEDSRFLGPVPEEYVVGKAFV